MEWLIIIGGILLILLGMVGSIAPLIPGPPIAYAGLLLQQLRTDAPFSGNFLWTWAAVTVGIMVLDYYVPIWGTKKMGGTKYGVWGCTIGLIAAFWMGPLGIVLGPFLGAFIGELYAGQSSQRSFRAAAGSLIGFLLGTVAKLVLAGIFLYYVITSI